LTKISWIAINNMEGILMYSVNRDNDHTNK
jgi:hypothetical protein